MNTLFEHTPGPWIVEETRNRKRGPVAMLMVVAEKGGMPGLIVNQGPVQKQDYANARAIAAAPDMIEIVEGKVAKELDAAHDRLSEAIEGDQSADEIHAAAVAVCVALNNLHAARERVRSKL
jgi:hypothetical protein